ncbi:hypothetical protein PINS_up008308 [Pythium insidiosum]|nr:hypothetical protein PINS_up008308 [Pythium insidiosum]
MQNFHYCPNLKVLYLYDNEIEAIEGLDRVRQLTHLHLQNNLIVKMEQLDALPLLEKLYLEGNQIKRLEGLEHCMMLQELHLSNQRLSPSSTFSFEPSSIQALCRSLRVLNLANCRVESVRALELLRGLQVLDLSKNLVASLEDVFSLVGSLSVLVDLDLTLNPVTTQPKYREKVITFSSPRLALLDKRDIDANQRRMMQSHMAHKFRKRQEQEQASNQEPALSSTLQAPSAAETIRRLKHGSAVHQLRHMSISSTKASALKPQHDNDLGVAGAACAPASTALVRASNSNNNH